ncbi:Methionyl-tRNA formyltransferase [hydrothermal vent metagenome]|uniref:methionyl-tRNA formyltransferase n=1 Tax=hydrothermal vent metagenome TaxID=652676 RepID=A0A1W1D2V7_9ZZZZ
MDIIFMGTPTYAQKILLKLLNTQGMNVVAVYTQPDKPVGRKRILTPSPVKELALEHNISVLQPQRLRDEDVVEKLLQIKCDYIVVAAYGQILPKAILDYAPCINLHASILPKYRGASPIQQVLLDGESKTGVTAMLMDVGLDTGDILKIVETPIDEDEMVESLFHKLTEVAATLTIDVLENFHSLTPQKQDESLASYCSKITKEDGKICFDDAQSIYNKYRAFTPWPGIYLESGLKLKKIALEEKEGKYEAGKILQIDKDGVIVGCQKGSLKIFRIQAPSKKEVDIFSYLNGKRLGLEDYIS